MPNIDIPLNPKQKIAQRALDDKTTRVIGFGGAKKGGKSYWGRGGILRRAIQYPGTNHLLTRRSYREVNTNHLADIKRLCRKWKLKVKFEPKDNYFYFPDFTHEGEPSRLYLGYAETLKDAERYVGIEWLTIWHEEATQVNPDVIMLINNELVVPAHAAAWGAMAKIIYTCNPVGIGKAWMKENVKRPGERGDPGVVWIFSNWEDNLPFKKANPNFAADIRKANRKQAWIAEALIDGNWDSDPDRFYCFDEETHVKTLKPPHWAKYYEGTDYGRWPSAFVVLFAARWRDAGRDGKEHFHVFAEVKEWRLDPDQQARLAMDKECELDLRDLRSGRTRTILRYADPATGKEVESPSDEVTRTVATMWDAEGWYTTPAEKHAKASGLIIINRLLREEILSIDPSCRGLIEELSSAVHEKSLTGKIGSSTDPRQDDDGQDSLRYMAVEVFGIEYARAATSEWDDFYDQAA